MDNDSDVLVFPTAGSQQTTACLPFERGEAEWISSLRVSALGKLCFNKYMKARKVSACGVRDRDPARFPWTYTQGSPGTAGESASITKAYRMRGCAGRWLGKSRTGYDVCTPGSREHLR